MKPLAYIASQFDREVEVSYGSTAVTFGSGRTAPAQYVGIRRGHHRIDARTRATQRDLVREAIRAKQVELVGGMDRYRKLYQYFARETGEDSDHPFEAQLDRMVRRLVLLAKPDRM